jgi:hypothetical protein
LREPSRLPPGLPDCPFANGLPRTRSARLSATCSVITLTFTWRRTLEAPQSRRNITCE